MSSKEADLTKNRVPIEGNFVLSLYHNPLELYGDYVLDPEKDLLTTDRKVLLHFRSKYGKKRN